MSQNGATGLGTTGATSPIATDNTTEANKKKILEAKKQISEAKIKISEAKIKISEEQAKISEAQAKIIGVNANNLVVSLADLAVKIIIGISKFDNLVKKIQNVNEEQDTLLGFPGFPGGLPGGLPGGIPDVPDVPGNLENPLFLVNPNLGLSL